MALFHAMDSLLNIGQLVDIYESTVAKGPLMASPSGSKISLGGTFGLINVPVSSSSALFFQAPAQNVFARGAASVSKCVTPNLITDACGIVEKSQQSSIAILPGIRG